MFIRKSKVRVLGVQPVGKFVEVGKEILTFQQTRWEVVLAKGELEVEYQPILVHGLTDEFIRDYGKPYSKITSAIRGVATLIGFRHNRVGWILLPDIGVPVFRVPKELGLVQGVKEIRDLTMEFEEYDFGRAGRVMTFAATEKEVLREMDALLRDKEEEVMGRVRIK